MSLESVAEKLSQKLSFAPRIEAKVKIDFDDEGLLFIDGTQSPPEISHEDQEADVVLSCAQSTFEGILDGTQDPNIAFMMGKLKVKGNMGLAMKLNSILED